MQPTLATPFSHQTPPTKPTQTNTPQVDWPLGLMEVGEGMGDGRMSSMDGTHATCTDGLPSPNSSLTAGRSGARHGRPRSAGALLSGVGAIRALITNRRSLSAADNGDGPTAWESSLQLAQLGGTAPPTPGADARNAGGSFSSHSASEASTSNNVLGVVALPPGAVGPAAARVGSAGSLTSSSTTGLGGQGSFDANTINGALGTSGSALASRGSLGSDSALGLQSALVRPALASTDNQTGSYASRRSGRRTSQSRFFHMLLGPSGAAGGAAQDARLFYGLRVRMGVASGALAAGVDIRNSNVFDVAKGESGSVVLGGVGIAGDL